MLHLAKQDPTKAVCGQTLMSAESNPPGVNPTCEKCLDYARKKHWVRSGGTGAAKAEARTGGPTPPTSTMHLKHKRSQLVELKDQLLTGEISYKALQSKAYPLQKEIQSMEAAA
ncbi:MAG: hypothetical protein KGO96_13195 [Elusimicrobia bacterium]|nr:hypothetical protein [Elusimicrobiota bacterium]